MNITESIDVIKERKKYFIKKLNKIISYSIYEKLKMHYKESINYVNIKKVNVHPLRVLQDSLKIIVPQWNTITLSNDINNLKTINTNGNLINKLLFSIINCDFIIYKIHVNNLLNNDMVVNDFLINCYKEFAREIYKNPYIMDKSYYNEIYDIIFINICNVLENLIPLTQFLDLNLVLEHKEIKEITEPPDEVKQILDKTSVKNENTNDLNTFLTKEKNISINNLKNI